MSVFKDKKTGTWRVIYRIENFAGEIKQKQKRGFATRKEAVEWEREELLKNRARPDMTFASFYELYEEERNSRIKQSTIATKEHIVRTKILPYFGKKKLVAISSRDVVAWQNELMRKRKKDGTPYSEDYLRSVHATLSAIFNHAVRYYNLAENPANRAGTIGKEIPKEMKFWTKEEYLKFAEEVMDKPQAYYAFEMLYWTGMREGELLALTEEDFDFENKTVRINKTYHRLRGQDIVTSPKTPKSNRTITLPDFLCEEMKEYLRSFYALVPDERIFPVTKYFLKREMERGCKQAGVEKIRVHDLRHSHVSLLIDLGFSALAIGERVGHEAQKITYHYAHLFPTVQTEMANKLDIERSEE